MRICRHGHTNSGGAYVPAPCPSGFTGLDQKLQSWKSGPPAAFSPLTTVLTSNVFEWLFRSEEVKKIVGLSSTRNLGIGAGTVPSRCRAMTQTHWIVSTLVVESGGRFLYGAGDETQIFDNLHQRKIMFLSR